MKEKRYYWIRENGQIKMIDHETAKSLVQRTGGKMYKIMVRKGNQISLWHSAGNKVTLLAGQTKAIIKLLTSRKQERCHQALLDEIDDISIPYQTNDRTKAAYDENRRVIYCVKQIINRRFEKVEK